MAAKAAVVIIALAIAGYYGVEKMRVPKPPPGQGTCTERFKAVEEAYKANFENRVESGSAFAVYHEGELVCDLWGGWANLHDERPWTEETMPVVFSTTKGVTAITFAHLCDRGLCDYDRLMTDYWPEFGQNGKSNVTLGMYLSHQAGLAAIDETIPLPMVAEDPDEVGRIIAAQKPNWPPGSASGYHALTFSIVVDQLIRRIDPKHRSLSQYFHEEIAEPFDIDFYIGAPLSENWRISHHEDQSMWHMLYEALSDYKTAQLLYKLYSNTDYVITRTFTNPTFWNFNLNHPKTRTYPQGSFNGYGTARALARLFSLVAAADKHDSLDDAPPLLSPAMVQRLHTPLHRGVDRVLGIYTAKGPGVFISENIDGKGGNGFYHAGKGTQLTMAIGNQKLSFSYVNSFDGSLLNPLEDPRLQPLFEAILAAL